MLTITDDIVQVSTGTAVRLEGSAREKQAALGAMGAVQLLMERGLTVEEALGGFMLALGHIVSHEDPMVRVRLHLSAVELFEQACAGRACTCGGHAATGRS